MLLQFPVSTQNLPMLMLTERERGGERGREGGGGGGGERERGGGEREGGKGGERGGRGAVTFLYYYLPFEDDFQMTQLESC